MDSGKASDTFPGCQGSCAGPMVPLQMKRLPKGSPFMDRIAAENNLPSIVI